jgi:alanyl-tRNA synthetase
MKEMEKMQNIDSKSAFKLYETYGLPFEIIKEKFPSLNQEEFENEFKKHQELSRTASAGMFKGGLADTSENSIKYHTSAHLMLEALRRVLGNHVVQKGSNITSERLRFDFSHDQKMTSEEIKKVEDLVNEKIKENLQVNVNEMSLNEAKSIGATGVFESKYGDKVTVYSIGDPLTGSGQVFSKEICGGPHVSNTGEIGKFRIVKEESSSAGIRRIKAVVE